MSNIFNVIADGYILVELIIPSVSSSWKCKARRRMRFLWRSGPVGGTRWPTYGRLEIEVDALAGLFPFSDLFIIGDFDLSLSSRDMLLLNRHVSLGNFYHVGVDKIFASRQI